MTSGQHIDYDALALEALRGVVRSCLEQVSRTGLVGDHHFYIAFNTQASGVGMSKRLKEKYPVEMTIVLQHRFWDLAVDEERFEVKLTFDGIPERLVVPFAAVKVFYDPSVPYVLQFEEIEMGQGDNGRRGGRRLPPGGRPATGQSNTPATAGEAPDGRVAPRGAERRRSRSDGAEESDGDASNGSRTDERPKAPAPAAAKPVPTAPTVPPSKPAVVAVAKAGDEADKPDDGSSPSDAAGAKIFDLSKFRGKK